MIDYNFRQIPIEEVNWDVLDSSEESTIYKTYAWYQYLYNWKHLKPFVAEIYTDRIIGYFCGELIYKGVKIIGSPFEGLGTGHQGLSMLVNINNKERLVIYKKMAQWIFKNNIADYVQIEDWFLEMSDIDDDEYIYEGHDGYMIDLSLSEDELYKNLHQKSCRYSINKSKKLGVSIRETMDVENFVDVYYLQLQEVFKKQGLSPTYKKDCVQALVKALYPDHILLLEAVTKDGEIAATGLFPGEKNIAVFWGGASYQKFQNLCPNEPLIWEAIRIWKNRGAKIFDMCGLRPYKLKFGPTLYTKPRIFFAKYRILIFAKRILKRIFYGLRKARAKFSK